MKPLLVTVFGSFGGLLNMVIFLFLMNFLGALMVCRTHFEVTKEFLADYEPGFAIVSR